MIARLALLALAVAWTTPAAAQSSWGVAVSGKGAIFFCDSARSIVWRIDPNGRRTAALTGVTCRAVVSGPDGRVHGEAIPGDVLAPRGVGVWQVDEAGNRQWEMAPTLTPQSGVWVTRDAEGREYSWTGLGAGSARSEIQLRDPSGAVLVWAGSEWGHRDGSRRQAAFGRIGGLAAAPDGTLIVVDSGDVRRVSAYGDVTTEARAVVTDSGVGLTALPGLWGRELGVASDASSAAVVVDPAAGRILHIDRGGRTTALWDSAGLAQRVSGGRWGWRPAGVAMLGRTYYVLDEWMGPALFADLLGSPRLMQVDDQGRVTRIAAISEWTVRAAAGALLLVVMSATLASLRKRRAR